MIGIVIAFGAGYIAMRLDDPVSRPLAKAVSPFVKVNDGEIRLVSFIIALLGAAVLVQATDNVSPFWLILAGSLGYFGARIYAAAKLAWENRSRD